MKYDRPKKINNLYVDESNRVKKLEIFNYAFGGFPIAPRKIERNIEQKRKHMRMLEDMMHAQAKQIQDESTKKQLTEETEENMPKAKKQPYIRNQFLDLPSKTVDVGLTAS